MELKIKEEKENPFFERKELEIELKHSGDATPSKQELIKELASKYSAPEENILVDYIFTKKGISESIVKVKIYKKNPKIKEKKEKAKPKKEAKPEAKKEEKPKIEEKPKAQKVEKKEEKKKEVKEKEGKSETQTSEAK